MYTVSLTYGDEYDKRGKYHFQTEEEAHRFAREIGGRGGIRYISIYKSNHVWNNVSQAIEHLKGCISLHTDEKTRDKNMNNWLLNQPPTVFSNRWWKEVLDRHYDRGIQNVERPL